MPRHSGSDLGTVMMILFRQNHPVKQLGSLDDCFSKLVNNRRFAKIKE